MKKTNEIVQRIQSHYVGDDCIQIMFPYQDALTIVNQDGMLYHHKPGSSVYVNKYLEDERRKQFPYSNIPTHFSKVRFRKIAYTNQLLDFEKPYIKIGDGYFSESFVIKDNNQALLTTSIMKPDNHVEHMTYDELLKYVGKHGTDEQIYYVYLSGEIPSNNEQLFPTEEEIYTHIKENLLKNIRDFEKESENYESYVGSYLRENPMFLDYVSNNMKRIDFSSMDFNVGINESMLIVRINKGNITIQGVKAMFVRKNDYKVDIYDIPVTKYSLEQLKYVPKINIAREPKIPLRLNPGVTRQDIKETKQMVKALRK